MVLRICVTSVHNLQNSAAVSVMRCNIAPMRAILLTINTKSNAILYKTSSFRNCSHAKLVLLTFVLSTAAIVITVATVPDDPDALNAGNVTIVPLCVLMLLTKVSHAELAKSVPNLQLSSV